ncbi:MAG TPA: ribonuclease P protein component [Actinomycetes bacterium]|nr:ribonuclease P protein component [Actinomycetes bacterium]
MLPAAHRMRRSHEFDQAVRGGRRAGSNALVVHATKCPIDASEGDSSVTRIGFVVSKQVGNSVIRHRVTRRLRALMAARVKDCPSGYLIVVRALPASANRASAELMADLDRALGRLLVTR